MRQYERVLQFESQVYRRDGSVIWIFQGATYRNSHCEALENDMVVLFTDGLFEVETADDEYYGTDRLLAAVCKRMHLPPHQLFGEVVAEIQQLASPDGSQTICAWSGWN